GNFTYSYKVCYFKDLAVGFLLCQIVFISLTVLVPFISAIFGTFTFSAFTLKFFKGLAFLFLYFFFAWLFLGNCWYRRFFTSWSRLALVSTSCSRSSGCSRCTFYIFTYTASAFFILILIGCTTGTCATNRFFLLFLFNRLLKLGKIDFLPCEIRPVKFGI